MPPNLLSYSAKALSGFEFPTESHRTAAATLLTMGEIFFSKERYLASGLKLRLFPLLAGETGSGKSFLVKYIANRLHARYMRVTRSDWIVQGSSRGRPTTYQIIDYIITNQRLIIGLDEIDKMQINFASHEWSASVAGDLWALLDGILPVAEYLRDTPFADQEKPTEQEVNSWIQSRMWIIGLGTWQTALKKNRTRSAIGFRCMGEDRSVDIDTLARSELVSEELLHRFSANLLYLELPSRDELVSLLESTGINALAKELGQTIALEDVNVNHGGIRSLETLATRLVIAMHRRKAGNAARLAPVKLPPADQSDTSTPGRQLES